MTTHAAQAPLRPRRIIRSAPRRAGTGQDRGVFAEIAHFLGPVGLSILCHIAFLFFLSITGMTIGSARDAINTEFNARVVAQQPTDDRVGSFQFPGRANLDRPDSHEKGGTEDHETLEDLTSLLKQDKSFQMTSVDVGESGLSTIAVHELDRGDVVGVSTLGGTSAAGSTDVPGSGLGDRDVAGGGPVGSMWGVGKGQQAHSVVYVMDRSGSMSDTFSLLQRELMRAVGALDSDQLFNIIWFNQGQATEWSARMRKATVENKRAAFDAIKRIVPEGQTEPMDAIRKALGHRPDVMFLLSDGDFGEENEKIINFFRQRNRRRQTIVNTILFIYDTMGKGDRVLREIAEINNGTFKHVTQEDIDRN